MFLDVYMAYVILHVYIIYMFFVVYMFLYVYIIYMFFFLREERWQVASLLFRNP